MVLKDTLPVKTEHVVFVRMTNIQRKLYRRFMEELLYNRCVSNPLKAFAVCCKVGHLFFFGQGRLLTTY